MNKLQQQDCKWIIIGKQPLTIKLIKARLAEYDFIVNQLKPNILINVFMHEEEKSMLALGNI